MSNSDRLDSASLERIVPDELSPGEATGAETLRLHMERYQFAADHLLPGNVLDIACGVGYGTALLAEKALVTHATGVDISSSSVEYARRRYGSNRIAFECANAAEFQPGMRFTNIVSLETIEHVDDPQRLFTHLASLLAPGGRFIASVPVTPSVDANPHHKTNFSADQFKAMGSKNLLDYVDSMLQVQKFNPIAIMTRTETRSASLRPNLPRFYLRNPSHLALRLWSTIRDGFLNKYLTIVWQRPLKDIYSPGASPK